MTNFLFSSGFFKEYSFPYLRLSQSSCGKVGTASFLLPLQKSLSNSEFKSLKKSLSILAKNKELKIKTTLLFVEGKPLGLKIFFLFKTSSSWITFLIFLSQRDSHELFYWLTES
jgi:hypothetical protein